MLKNMRNLRFALLFLVPFVAIAQVPTADSGTYALQDVTGVSTVWASHVPAEALEERNIKPYMTKIRNERASMPAFVSPLRMTDGIGKLQKNFLSFRRGPDGEFEGLLRYGDNSSPVAVINGSHSMSFVEMNDDAATTYTVHRNVRLKDGSYLVTVSATKSTGLYVCTWSFAGRASLETK
jgi:uncharacterized protein YodC (DUF2158 family)